MDFYRICLIILHIISALCYLPHLIVHINYLSWDLVPFRSQVAYITYWFNYCITVLAVLIWCLFVVCRKQTTWQVIQVSEYLLIAKLIYTLLDVITRFLLRHSFTVVVFDIIHIFTLFPAILVTFLLARNVKRIPTL